MNRRGGKRRGGWAVGGRRRRVRKGEGEGRRGE